jgi:hypothetical protein
MRQTVSYTPTKPLPPPPAPGQVVSVPLDRWIEYRQTYGLVVVEVQSIYGKPVVIRVRCTAPVQEANHEQP